MTFRFHRSIIILILITLNNVVAGQANHPKLEISSTISASNGPLFPLWLYANQWGKYPFTPEIQSTFYLKLSDTLFSKNNFNLKTGIAGVIIPKKEESFLHEAFIGGRFYCVDFSLGLEAYSPVIYDDKLLTGSFLMSSNARPVPKLSVGIYDWTSVPFIKNWVQIKGGISQGYLNDDSPYGLNHKQVYLHEKFAYVRLSHYRWKPYGGIVHSALFGGENIPVDFWATFFAKGSAKLGGGEATNAAGAHMGMYDFGVDKEEPGLGKLHLYLHKPFADGSGMLINHGANKDYYLGIVLYPHNSKIIKGVGFEIIKTDYQSGNGMPDPMFPAGHPKEGQLIFPAKVADVDQFMYDEFGETTTGWGRSDLQKYLEDNFNHGNSYGGRDDYMNNGMYPAGWSYFGMSTGTPLYHTLIQASAYAPGSSGNKGLMFVNNRVNGFNLGCNGTIKKLDYYLKFTHTRNYGSYSQEYPGRYTWTRVPDFYYDTHVSQNYTLFEISYPVLKDSDLRINVDFGFDYGALYKSSGLRISLNWKPTL